MSRINEGHGQRLYALVKADWDAQGITRNAWCDMHPGLQGPTVSRWEKGTSPGVDKLRLVAEALNMGMLELLVAIGVLSSDEAGGVVPAPRPDAPSVSVAIERDPSLSDWERDQMRNLWSAIHAVEARTAQQASRSTTRRNRSTT